MKILIIGSGAREHGIGEKIKDSPLSEKLYFAPGNGGTLAIGENVDIAANDVESLLDFAKNKNIDFTIVGPEDPLNLGIVDLFEKEGLKIFGPSKDAALLEGSKSYAKEFMNKHKIPTGKYIKSDNFDDSLRFTKLLLENSGKAVIKADGLCAGKGVFIVNNEKDASKYLKEILVNGNYGCKKVIIEEFLTGFEMSLLAFVDNNSIKMLPTSKDHKRIYDGENGLNTGGMGTYSPNLQAEAYLEDIDKLVLQPFLEGIKADKLDFRGVIFVGLMVGDSGIKVLEFNTRLGDPETQSILNRLESDLLEIMVKTSENKLSEIDIEENNKKVVTLVLVSGGYPESYEKGHEITGLDRVEGVKIYHAGTKLEDGKLVTSGGRVLSIVSVEDSFEEAIKKVYKEAEKINFTGKYNRKDIGPMVNRYYIEKNNDLFLDSKKVREDIKRDLEFDPGTIRIFDRFDIEGLNSLESKEVIHAILIDSNCEVYYKDEEAFELEGSIKNSLVVEFQEGQFNEKEYATIKNLQLFTNKDDINVKNALVYSFEKDLSKEEKEEIENYIINKTNQKRGNLLGLPTTLKIQKKEKLNNHVYQGFTDLNKEDLESFLNDYGLAMSLEDLFFVQDYFKSLGRDINETELYILDTYWSDHCRHTTFNTILDVKIKDPITPLDHTIQREFNEYLKMRSELNRQKPISLMDFGTIVAKYLKTTGDLNNVEDTDEVNACSIEIEVKIEDRATKEIKSEEYLLMFKNETHNHPTEIEPYGGAHTCIGGGIRDPLSGRAFVYQAMRISGAGDPRSLYKDTIKGKLPQKRIVVEASDGYSKYSNEIGLAGGLVDEIYHDGFLAKRMELGALVGAQKKEYVTRKDAELGDLIILLGAKTGRDGVGAATGSSGEQDENLIDSASPEVQRGNPPLERNIIRLFRNPEATKLIKKSNDFGAGGVSVAIGELADSLDIYLDRVPLKYPGLTPKEIAISESQERMAVVIDPADKEKFLDLCKSEDIEATLAAEVTDTKKMIMYYHDQVVCELDRDFLNSSGADRYQEVLINNNEITGYFENYGKNLETLYSRLEDLNYVSKKNLYGKFDFTIGRGTVLAPLGGENLSSPIQTMVATIPSLEGNSKTVSLMSYGYNPFLLEKNQFLGGYYSVIESLTKLAAVGGNPFKARLSFQEYFESLENDPSKWAKPLKALLGAFYACRELKVAPIGGKDSMSGTFKDINVPPTLVSFAVNNEDLDRIISSDLKGGYKLGLIKTERLDDNTLNHEQLISNLEKLYESIKTGNIKSAYGITYKGLLHNLLEMSVGANVGFILDNDNLFDPLVGSLVVEYDESADFIEPIGLSGGDTIMVNGEKLDTDRFLKSYFTSLDDIYPKIEAVESKIGENKINNSRQMKLEKDLDEINSLIVIVPGTTGEYDIEEILLDNDINVSKFVFKMENLKLMEESVVELSKLIKNADMLILPSGMVNGDEPNGSGKLIDTILRKTSVREAVEDLIARDGLILGIGSGFHGLVRTGLLPFGQYIENRSELPVFTKNINNNYISTMTKVIYKTNNSPWLSKIEVDKEYFTPISTAYGRLVLSEELYSDLSENEQILSVYKENYPGSAYSIEGLLSKDGKIIGKNTNFERIKEGTLINIPKKEIQALIESAVDYFKN